MEAKELRIGNWVYSTFEEKKVQINYITVWQGGYGKSDFNPVESFNGILLTEEILLKCGFEKESKIHFFRVFGSLRITYEIEYGRLFIGLEKGQLDDICLDFFVHELHKFQNIIFALTGEELNVE